MRGCRHGGATALVLAACGFLGAAPAQAASVSVAPVFGLETLTYRAAPGEANRLSVTAAGRTILLADPAGITPGAGCARPAGGDPTRASCALPQPLTGVPMDAVLGDGDDVVAAQLPAAVDVAEIRGGPGNDVIRGGGGEDRLEGGPGRDDLFGFARDDTFVTSSLDGPDTMHGGVGIGDEVSYSGRGGAVFADLDGRRDDGQRGEGDLIETDVEDLTGGDASDRLTSFSQPSTMTGGPGNDVMRGGASTDELFGNAGRDRLSAGSGSDKVEGGRGSDRISGGRGSDLLRGEDGDDRIRSRDARSDRVGCGRGRDRIVLDRLDMAFPSCERVSRNGPAIAALIGVEGLPEGFSLFGGELQDREIDVGLGCPRDHRRRCAGTARLVRRGRTLASVRFSLGPGRQNAYTVRVPPSVARAVARRGRLNARLVVLSRDPRGRAYRLNSPFTLFETLPTLD